MAYLITFNYLGKRHEMRVGNNIAAYLYASMKLGNISNMAIKKFK